jgi:uracil phosphoribosyltransferase
MEIAMVRKINNSLIQNYISKIRNIDLDSFLFRKYIGEIAQILAMKALENEEMIIKKTPTWIGEQEFPFMDEEKYVFIPILRAALPMLDGILDMLPNSKAGFLALKRDEETFESKLFYDRVPDLNGKVAILLDPMVATGGSLNYAIEIIKKKNPSKIMSFNVIGSPEGLDYVSKKHPDVDIYIAQIDKELNSKKYILPGIGDAGDRAYNTL